MGQELARTLRAFAKQGRRAIYSGPVARAIVAANRRRGGVLTLDDLERYRALGRRPLSGRAFGFRWFTAPPPSAGGFTLLSSLRVLERIPAASRALGVGRLHALAESWKGPFADRARYFGDPDFVDIPLAALGAPARIARRAALFDPDRARPAADYALPLSEPSPAPALQREHGTSHLCVVDAEGNVASVTTTVNLPFGARYTAAGIVLNDEMDDFASAVGETNAFGLVGGAQNLPGPRRRPVSTMSPTIVFRDGRPVLCAGGAGGSRIVTAVEQVALHVLVDGMTAGEAVAAPRIHEQGPPGGLEVERSPALPDATIDALRALGHDVSVVDHLAVVQAIAIRSDGTLDAASDPRKGGAPAGR